MITRAVVALLLIILLVSCASATQVYLLDKTWGSHGTANGQFNGNLGISITGSRVYVADCSNYRVQIFDLDGVYKSKFGSSGSGSGQFWSVRQAVVDSLGNFFVVDSDNDRVTRYNTSYVPMAGWGSEGTGNLNFKAPWSMAINPTTNMLYVADMLNSRICQWTTGGTFVRKFGSLGATDGKLNYPEGVALDAAGNVYVADYENHRVQKFTATGTFVSKWAVGPSSNPGGPCALALDSSGDVFVADDPYGKIRKYNASGVEIASFGSTGTGPGQFYSATGIAVDSKGRVFVADGQDPTDRIQRFTPDTLPTAPTKVTISPTSPHNSDNLTATAIGATDADAGTVLTYAYKWYHSTDNLTWTGGPTTKVVNASLTSTNQYWLVKARAYDGKVYGAWKSSTSVKIVAGAPVLASATALAAAGGNIAVTVSLAGAATVDGQLCNLAGKTVAVFAGREMKPGVTDLLLPARSTLGTKLPGGQYLLKLTIRGTEGQNATSVAPVVLP